MNWTDRRTTDALEIGVPKGHSGDSPYVALTSKTVLRTLLYGTGRSRPADNPNIYGQAKK